MNFEINGHTSWTSRKDVNEGSPVTLYQLWFELSSMSSIWADHTETWIERSKLKFQIWISSWSLVKLPSFSLLTSIFCYEFVLCNQQRWWPLGGMLQTNWIPKPKVPPRRNLLSWHYEESNRRLLERTDEIVLANWSDHDTGFCFLKYLFDKLVKWWWWHLFKNEVVIEFRQLLHAKVSINCVRVFRLVLVQSPWIQLSLCLWSCRTSTIFEIQF